VLAHIFTFAFNESHLVLIELDNLLVGVEKVFFRHRGTLLPSRCSLLEIRAHPTSRLVVVEPTAIATAAATTTILVAAATSATTVTTATARCTTGAVSATVGPESTVLRLLGVHLVGAISVLVDLITFLAGVLSLVAIASSILATVVRILSAIEAAAARAPTRLKVIVTLLAVRRLALTFSSGLSFYVAFFLLHRRTDN
jgi:hypothetical protein